MASNKRVLIIAYHYPPLAGAGMLKIWRTTRYLAQYGWEPLVLTVKNPEPYFRADNPVPQGVTVFRAWRLPGGNLLARVLRRLRIDERSFLLPDQHLFWLPGLLLTGVYLIKKYRINLIYATSPPYTALLGAAILKKLTGHALVVDIRDPWSFNAARHGYPTRFHHWLDQVYENWVLRTADYLTCIYRITADGYRRLYPSTASKLAVFYDTVDLADLPKSVEPYPVFTLTYLGTFYPPFHSLRATLQAIRSLLDQAVIEKERFCLNYVGPRDLTFERLITEFALVDLVKQTGYQTLKNAQLEAAKSQQLLLLLEFPTINTKLFDYLACGREILAVVPQCPELNGLLEKYSDNYSIINDFDSNKIAQQIRKCYNRFNQGIEVELGPKATLFREELNIEAETAQLAGLFNEIYEAKE